MTPIRCHLAITYWNPIRRAILPLPDGVVVQARDRDTFTADDALTEAPVIQGRIALLIEARDEAHPDLFFALITTRQGIDLRSDALVALPEGAHPDWLLPLPEDWSTRRRWSTDGRPGLLKDFAETTLGSPAVPVTFRLTLDSFLRFVWFLPGQGRLAGLPAGITVRAFDADPLGDDDLLGAGVTDETGALHIALDVYVERAPDVYFTFARPSSGPWHLDPDTGVLTRDTDAGIPLPRQWSSRDEARQGTPGELGQWIDLAAAQLGAPEQPHTFDIFADQPRSVPGNRVEALIDGPQALSALEDLIDGAVDRIHVEVMFFFNDPIGHRLADRLIAAAQRGVAVRVMFDVRTTTDSADHINLRKLWVGQLIDMPAEERTHWLAELDTEQVDQRIRGDTTALRERLTTQPGITLLDSSFPYVQLSPDALGSAPPAYRALDEALPFFTVARIDHRKMVIVDGQRAILGGMNIGQEYLYAEPIDPTRDAVADAAASEAEPWTKWHDAMVDVAGPVVAQLDALFAERWLATGGEPFPLLDPAPPHPDGLPVRIVDTTPGARQQIHADWRSRLTAARKRIWILSPYFSSGEITAMLITAALRGVAVHVLFTGRRFQDSIDFYYSGRLRYSRLLAAGVHVYEYRHHMSHAKVAVIDDAAIIGSANLNRSSFASHYEVGAVIEDAAFSDALVARLFEADQAHCVAITMKDAVAPLDIGPAGRAWVRGVVDVWF
ncbi:MAG: phosphatidylserine/phosphatidylglycerophosphate/cardiolipin synthase-like enzyme [Myxococcota bacterium]|jgi:phosphatidylserine/phosphatidylglycerophosphate/cardiolipin synthase-like enzyme